MAETMERTEMRCVDLIWADELPNFYEGVEKLGYNVELGAGNFWIDAYHHVGREISTDAPKSVLIQLHKDSMQETLSEKVEIGMCSVEEAQAFFDAAVRELEAEIKD